MRDFGFFLVTAFFLLIEWGSRPIYTAWGNAPRLCMKGKKMQYTDFNKFAAALDSGKIPGVILWRGASAIDGAPIVLVANRFADDSGNEKTGAMVQTWILPDPHAAGIEVNGSRPAKIMAWLKSTGARSICGDCPHAWQYNEEAGEYEKGSCYVREYQAPAATLGGVYRGAYPIAGVDFPAQWIWCLGKGRQHSRRFIWGSGRMSTGNLGRFFVNGSAVDRVHSWMEKRFPGISAQCMALAGAFNGLMR